MTIRSAIAAGSDQPAALVGSPAGRPAERVNPDALLRVGRAGRTEITRNPRMEGTA